MTAETISAIAGVLLSLVFAYFPGVSGWFANLDGTYKRLVMALSLLMVAGGALALSCWQIMYTVSCDQAGIVALVQSFIAALVANQATYSLAVRPPALEYIDDDTIDARIGTL
jgi:hypothetical protein